MKNQFFFNTENLAVNQSINQSNTYFYFIILYLSLKPSQKDKLFYYVSVYLNLCEVRMLVTGKKCSTL